MKCPVCKKEVNSVNIHIGKKAKNGGKEHKKYLQEFLDKLNLFIDSLFENYTQKEIMEKVLLEFNNTMQLSKVAIANKIRNRAKELGVNTREVTNKKRQGEGNPVHKKGIKEKIAKSVKKKWKEGVYKKRINGMLGKVGKESPRFKKENYTYENQGVKYFNTFLSYFQDISTCSLCSEKKKINVHHIDEDHNNFLISNLEPLCVPCHTKFHYNTQKQPYVIIGKDFYFAGAHKLPKHPRKCKNLHGHEWKLRINIRKRINPTTGMVMDFSDLKQIVNTFVIDKLDHSYLNDFFINPTAENILVWIWEQLMFEALLKGIYSIEIWESKDSSALITIPDMLSVFSKRSIDYDTPLSK